MRSLIFKSSLMLGFVLVGCIKDDNKSRFVETDNVSSMGFSARPEYTNGKMMVEFTAPPAHKDRTFELKSITIGEVKGNEGLKPGGKIITAVPVIEKIEFYSKTPPNTNQPAVSCSVSGVITPGGVVGICQEVNPELDKQFVAVCEETATGADQKDSLKSGCLCQAGPSGGPKVRLFAPDYYEPDTTATTPSKPMKFNALRFKRDCEKGEKIDCREEPKTRGQIEMLKGQFMDLCNTYKGAVFVQEDGSCKCRGDEISVPFSPKMDGGFVSCKDGTGYFIDELKLQKIPVANEFLGSCAKNTVLGGAGGGLPPNALPQTGGLPPSGITGVPPLPPIGMTPDDMALITAQLNLAGQPLFSIKTAQGVTRGAVGASYSTTPGESAILPVTSVVQKSSDTTFTAPMILEINFELTPNGAGKLACRARISQLSNVPQEIHVPGGAECQ